MYDTGKVLVGLAIFAGIFTYPFWHNVGSASTPPKLQLPKDEKKCVQEAVDMRAGHMQILEDWRNIVVREGKRNYVGLGGKEFNMSLQNTCMKCHTSKKEFCDKCHAYVDVNPYCWTCHIEPKEKV